MLKDTVTTENVNTLVQGATSVQIVILVFLGIIACGVIFFLFKCVIDLKVVTFPQDIKEIKDSLNENKLKMAQMESKLWSHDDMAREIASAINQHAATCPGRGKCGSMETTRSFNRT